MKDRAISIVEKEKNPEQARNKLREYLQHVILRELFEQNVLDNIVFHGGTALRILYDLRRFSEDLDFHTGENAKFDLKDAVKKIKKHLPMQGYRLNFKEDYEGTVQSAFINFDGILYEASLTRQREEKLRVKIEVDTSPPDGFETDSSLVNKYFPFGITHHDRQSFLAGKLHAVLQRTYTKGRDYYDLWFYLSRWENLTPNFVYLNNALKQTDYSGPALNPNNWKEITSRKIEEVEWDYVISDVEPFLQNQNDLKVFTRETLLESLQS